MRFVSSVRQLSLGLATASFLVAGSALAQTGASSTADNASASVQTQSWNLVGVNARLDRGIDTKKSQPGQKVEARLVGSVRTASGLELHGGTRLLGTIASVQASSHGDPAVLSIVFTQAELKDGRTIPVKVTVLGAFPAATGEDAADGIDLMGPAPGRVSSKERVDQEPGLLHDVTMTSAVQSPDSATFRDNKGNIDLEQGTGLQLAIAPGMGHGSAVSSGD